MKIFKTLALCLVCISTAVTLSSCEDDKPEINNGGIDITPDDPEGSVGVNLVKGQYQMDNSISFISHKDGFVGGCNLYLTGQENFAFRTEYPDLVCQIRDINSVRGLSAIATIPTTEGWSAQCAATLKHGYIIRYQLHNEQTGEYVWEYARLYVCNYYAMGSSVNGLGVKYQPKWQFSAPFTK